MNNIDDSFPWLQTAWSQLANYIEQNRIPQALLIYGNKGLGKHKLVKQFANSLLCLSSQANHLPCGKCQSCILFDAETHPDFIIIEPEEAGKAIGIAVIRQLISKLALKPQYEKQRVVVINPAHSLNNASANAFLKYLEEPTERTSLILITEKPSRLPATILSRCQKLILSAPDETVLIEWLNQQGITENLDLLAALSKGAPLLAKQFADSDVIELRNKCFENWSGLIQFGHNFTTLAEQWQKLEPTEMDLLLFWMISWISDIIKLASLNRTEPTNLYNPDLTINLQEFSQKLELKGLFKYYDFLLLSYQRLDTQLNKQLMFEEILIQWLQLNNRYK